MSTWGAGDPTPSAFVGAEWGAGAPTPSAFAGAEWGAGDPTLTFLSASILPAQPGDHLVPDDGGELIKISAIWPVDGPYTVALTEAHTGQEFPCYGGPGNGADCYLTPAGYLLAALPPMPPGIYDVSITWATGTVTIPSALRAVWRGRSVEQWSLAARYRPSDRPGPRSSRDAARLGV